MIDSSLALAGLGGGKVILLCAFPCCDAKVKIEKSVNGTSKIYRARTHRHKFIEQTYQDKKDTKLSGPLKSVIAACVIRSGRPESRSRLATMLEEFSKTTDFGALVGDAPPVTGWLIAAGRVPNLENT